MYVAGWVGRLAGWLFGGGREGREGGREVR